MANESCTKNQTKGKVNCKMKKIIRITTLIILMCSIIVFAKNDLQTVLASTEESSEIELETSLVSIED